MLSSNSTTVKKKSETSGEQLRRMCKRIANSISEPQQITDEETGEKREETASDWMEDVYDTSWTGRSVTWAPSSWSLEAALTYG